MADSHRSRIHHKDQANRVHWGPNQVLVYNPLSPTRDCQPPPSNRHRSSRHSLERSTSGSSSAHHHSAPLPPRPPTPYPETTSVQPSQPLRPSESGHYSDARQRHLNRWFMDQYGGQRQRDQYPKPVTQVVTPAVTHRTHPSSAKLAALAPPLRPSRRTPSPVPTKLPSLSQPQIPKPSRQGDKRTALRKPSRGQLAKTPASTAHKRSQSASRMSETQLSERRSDTRCSSQPSQDQRQRDYLFKLGVSSLARPEFYLWPPAGRRDYVSLTWPGF